MGDRCWLQVTIHPDDIDKISDGNLLEPDEINQSCNLPKGVLDYTFYEANYGHNDDLHAAAAAGVRFRALQGSGDEYPAMVIVGWDNAVYEAVTDNDYCYTVSVDVSGNVCEAQLQNVRSFIGIEKRFMDCIRDFSLIQREIVPLKDWTPCDETKTLDG
jgi:hypothetical protein